MNWLDCCDKNEDLTHELEKSELEKFIENHNSLKSKKCLLYLLKKLNPLLIAYNFPIMKTSRLRRQSTLSLQYL